jgi:hypothetical protein
VRQLQEIWSEAGRDGVPQIVALDYKPVAEKLEHWAQIGVTEVLFGLPDKSTDEVAAYVERLAGKLTAMV